MSRHSSTEIQAQQNPALQLATAGVRLGCGNDAVSGGLTIYE